MTSEYYYMIYNNAQSQWVKKQGKLVVFNNQRAAENTRYKIIAFYKLKEDDLSLFEFYPPEDLHNQLKKML